MRFDILTLFPEMFKSLSESIIGRAREKGLIEVNIINIRDFSTDKHGRVDDTPYGGGAGMVMRADYIYNAYQSIIDNLAYKPQVIYMSPKGETLTQNLAKSIANIECQHIIILCGHYEGIDERALELLNAQEISIGDYVLTGGELPAMVLVDAVSRMVSGVLNQESIEEESFNNGLLEYPQYTRPYEFMGKKVPDILISGNHQEIKKWREQKSVEITKRNRPDLLKE